MPHDKSPVCRVLQIVSAPARKPWGNIGVGGPERRAANLVHQWRDKGIEPIVCYPRRGNLWDTFAKAKVKLIEFEIGGKTNVFAAARIAMLAQENGVHVVHTQGPASLDLLACIGGRLSDIPVVVTRPVMIEDQVNYSWLRRYVYSVIDRLTVLRMARCIVAVSAAGYRHLREVGCVNDRRLELIHNGIDLNRFSFRQQESLSVGTNTRPVVIGMVAQLTPPKGWPEFIEVIHQLRRKGLNVRGMIVGEGELRDALEREVKYRGLQEHIEFTGYKDDVSNMYHRMDLFLFTTHREGLSVAVIEAMASGLPIVATEVGGIREQVEDERNGYVVKVGDIDAMVYHCTRLIQDAGVRVAMGRISRSIAEQRFSEERMLEQYVACYRHVAVREMNKIIKSMTDDRGT